MRTVEEALGAAFGKDVVGWKRPGSGGGNGGNGNGGGRGLAVLVESRL